MSASAFVNYGNGSIVRLIQGIDVALAPVRQFNALLSSCTVIPNKLASIKMGDPLPTLNYRRLSYANHHRTIEIRIIVERGNP